MDKTKDILFMQSIEKYNLVFLAETHVGYDSGIKHIGQFLYHPICRPVEKANNRYFGGLAILRYLKDCVKILKNTNPDYQWIKLEKSNFGFPKDLYICVTYYPLVESSCEKITILRQKIKFFPIAEGGAKIFGVFHVKNHGFTPKNLIFSNFKGGRTPDAPSTVNKMNFHRNL
jgi:hypothetical protein